jgi:hypothetical protein
MYQNLMSRGRTNLGRDVQRAARLDDVGRLVQSIDLPARESSLFHIY